LSGFRRQEAADHFIQVNCPQVCDDRAPHHSVGMAAVFILQQEHPCRSVP
jgi:hypothetical protein